jgi:hypothetical protein
MLLMLPSDASLFSDDFLRRQWIVRRCLIDDIVAARELLATPAEQLCHCIWVVLLLVIVEVVEVVGVVEVLEVVLINYC